MIEVSVIITTHNRPLALARACQSVLHQTMVPMELIVVDDGSDLPVTEQLAQLEHPQIKLKMHRWDTPHGACQARNQGAAMALGEILMFLDDDDTWEPTKIADQVQVFNSNQEIGLVYSGKLIVRASDREQVLYQVPAIALGKLYPQILSSNLIGSTSSVALKKSLFEEVGGFDSKMPALQDYDLWIRCCQKTIVGHDGHYNLRYTLSDNPKQQISGQPNRYIEASRRLLAKYRHEIDTQGLLTARKIYSTRYFSVAKSQRLQGLKPAIPWIIGSLWRYPNWKAAALIFPLGTTIKLRRTYQQVRQSLIKPKTQIIDKHEPDKV